MNEGTNTSRKFRAIKNLLTRKTNNDSVGKAVGGNRMIEEKNSMKY